jgi:hypothetical protein
VPGGVGVDFPCPGREPGSCPHMRTPGAWVACPFTGSDPHTTWHWGWLALFPRLKVKPGVTQGPNMIKKKLVLLLSMIINIIIFVPQIIIFFYINSLNYNKNKYYYSQL